MRWLDPRRLPDAPVYNTAGRPAGGGRGAIERPYPAGRITQRPVRPSCILAAGTPGYRLSALRPQGQVTTTPRASDDSPGRCSKAVSRLVRGCPRSWQRTAFRRSNSRMILTPPILAAVPRRGTLEVLGHLAGCVVPADEGQRCIERLGDLEGPRVIRAKSARHLYVARQGRRLAEFRFRRC